MVRSGARGWPVPRQHERRRLALHPASACFDQVARSAVPAQSIATLPHEIRNVAGALESERRCNPSKRNQAVVEGEVRQDPALKRPVARRNRITRGVERLRHGRPDAVEVRSPGMDLRATILLALLLPIDDPLNPVDPFWGPDEQAGEGDSTA